MKVPKITIFSTKTCLYCKLEIEYLENKKIKYVNYLIDSNPKKAEEMVRTTRQMSVPATVLEYEDGDKTYFIGFRHDLLGKMIAGEKIGKPCAN